MQSIFKPIKFHDDVYVNPVCHYNNSLHIYHDYYIQPAFTCSKATIEAPEQCVKSVQS